MFPFLVIMYARLAKQEENESRAAFGDAYDRYAARVPAFLPRWARLKKGALGSP
jgi:protein-S-isoprenylcysteine O-methyltransferase Ste14